MEEKDTEKRPIRQEFAQLTVDFLTLGDAARSLDISPSTLRYWCNELEKTGVHMLERIYDGGRSEGERIFYPIDLEIMMFMKEMRDQYGRKITTDKIAPMIATMYECRSVEIRSDLAVYRPEPMLQDLDAERLVNHPAFQELLQSMVQKATQSLIPADIAEQLKAKVVEELEATKKELAATREEITSLKDATSSEIRDLKQIENERLAKMTELMDKTMEIHRMQSLPWWKKMFGSK